MSRTAIALLALALIVLVGQWLWARAIVHVDPALIPACSRRRVQWLRSNTAHIEYASALLALCAVGLQAAALALIAPPHELSALTPQRRGRDPCSTRRDDPELVDLAVDRRAGHAERPGGLDLVAVGVGEALHDRVALERLERRQHPRG